MSTTTAILFNSAALHSLKRDQLVKLCKIHSLKANGKNVELIERLKAKAAELPPEAAEWHDSDAEPDLSATLDALVSPTQLARPSEQWEMVMDDIEEEDETSSNANTLRSMRSVRTIGTAGEFGTGPSKPSVKGSLKAIASSFGIRRGGSNKDAMTVDVGTTKSLPTLPSQEGRQEPAIEPIPGNPSRPGAPAPANARLSTGTAPGTTTTIRLISMATAPTSMPTPPRLKPYQTTFELDMDSPSAATKKWPASPEKPSMTRLYPAIPYEDMRSAASAMWKTTVFDPEIDSPSKNSGPKQFPPDSVNDMFSPAKRPPAERRQSRLSVPQNQPFLFGSPNPRQSLTNKQFGNAAADVLEEMNRRLVEAGVQKVEKTILEVEKKPASGSVPANKEAPEADRFEKAHEAVFNKMDSIANHYAARRPIAPPASKKRKSDALGIAPSTSAAKRRSNVAGARVISSGTRKNMIPGGFGMEDDDESEEDASDRRMSKRIRVTDNEDVHKGKRVSLLPQPLNEEEERRKSREREAMRKKIDARRRSSRGRPSMGGRPITPAKPKGSRFGFFGAAKTLVKSVWNMGAGGSGKAAPSSNIPKPTVAAKPVPPPMKKAAPPKETMQTERKASGSLTSKSSLGQGRAGIPSFAAPTQASLAAAAPGGTGPLKARSSSNPSVPPPSSMGSRTSAVPGPSTVSSLGGRRSASGPKDVSSPASTTGGPARKRTISTLLAPTASSLAKRQNTQAGPSVGMKSPSLTPVSPLAAHNGTRPSIRSPAPTPSKIFSQPLNYHGSPNPKNENASLAAAATSLYNRNRTESTTSTGSNVPPKPKTLIARKPRVSRSRVIAKLGQQRAASGASTASRTSTNSNASGRLRSSMGGPRRSVGGAKGQRIVSGGDVVMSAKKRARQSEIQARRKSRAAAGSSIGLAPKMQSSPVRMDID